jgi:YggT family protein
MGVTATFMVLGDAISKAETFVNVFITVYTLVIFAYIITSWLRLPYSTTLNRIQRFLYDVSEPYLRLFRRFLPSFGPLDLSPMVAIIVLWLFDRVLITVLNRFN